MEANEDEIEMTPAELRSWIQEEVDTSDLVVLKRALLDQVQTLIKQREKQAAATQNIYSCTYESVKECESVMKELYSQLGIIYRDTDSEEEDVVSQECFINADHNEDDNTKALNNADVNSTSSGSTTAVTIAPSPASNSSENGSPRSEIDEGSSAKDTNNKKQPGDEGDPPQLPRNRRAIRNDKFCVTLSQGTTSGPRTSEKVVTSSDDSDWDPQTSGCADSDSDSDFSVSSRKGGAKYGKSRKSCPISAKKVKNNKKEPQLKKDMTSKPISAGPPQDQEATKCGSVALTDTKDSKKEESCTTVVSSVSLPALNPDTHPPVGLEEEEVKLNMVVWARTKTRTWHEGKIVEIKTVVHGLKYKVDFGENGQRWVSGNHIAFSHTPSLSRLYVGVRVVTKCQQATESWYSSGVLAELPNRKNRMRFLVFFDDGIPSYVGLPLLHLVCQPSVKNVLEDIEEEANRNFVTDYIKIYPNPPMAQYRVGQTINTEFEGVQKRCEVEQIDSSLIEILFLDDGHREWVYRGSMRLEHIANMKKRFEESKIKKDTVGHNITLGKQTFQSSKHSSDGPSTATAASGSAGNVAKQTGTTNSSNNDKTGTTPASSLVYTPHRCCRACIDHLQAKGDIKHRGRNPLLVPLLLEFRRIKGLQRIKGKTSFHVFYGTPCGLSLRTMAAVQDYLLQTCCDFVRLDMFCMDPFVSVTTTHQPLPSKILIPDLSLGRENQPLSCVNEHSNIRPPTVNYIRDRTMAKGISINNGLDFLEGCDCTDGCMDSLTCSCHQLTIHATSLYPGGPVDINAGYSHKRLEKRIPTGLYECNSLCRCNPHLCSNRVVQHGVQTRLQLFMTLGKGWGIRTLDDVAKGTFICTFAGKIKTNEEKNASANVYYVKLNHIEQVEIFKDDYEKEAYCSDSETDTGKDIVESIEDSSSDSGDNYINKELLRDSGDNFNPNVSSLERSETPHRNTKVLDDATLHSRPGVNPEHPQTAELPPLLADRTDLVTRHFFEEEECYVIDAKLEGNLARYLNHSCLPNLFEQNVFVDTHDLRFPLIAYFAKKRIRAGTELTLKL